MAAALEAYRETFAEGGGSAVLRAVPWLAEVPPSVLLRASCRVWGPRLDQRLSAKWGRSLDRSVRELDRLDGPGAGAAFMLSLTGEDHGRPDPLLVDLLRQGKPRRDKDPRTLGAVAVAVRRWARRQAAAARRGERPKVRKAATRG